MISFTCDYTEGAHPAILGALLRTNMDQQPGYGEDCYTAAARARIREACGCSGADVYLLVGGTQTNSTVIATSWATTPEQIAALSALLPQAYVPAP